MTFRCQNANFWIDLIYLQFQVGNNSFEGNPSNEKLNLCQNVHLTLHDIEATYQDLRGYISKLLTFSIDYIGNPFLVTAMNNLAAHSFRLLYSNKPCLTS